MCCIWSGSVGFGRHIKALLFQYLKMKLYGDSSLYKDSPYLTLDRYTDEAYVFFLGLITNKTTEICNVLSTRFKQVLTIGTYKDHVHVLTEIDLDLLQQMTDRTIPVDCFHRSVQAYRAKIAYQKLIERKFNKIDTYIPWCESWDKLTAFQQQNTITYLVRQKAPHTYTRSDEEYWWTRDDNFENDEMIFERYKDTPENYFMSVHDTIDFAQMEHDVREYLRINFHENYKRYERSWVAHICAFRCGNSNKVEFYWKGIPENAQGIKLVSGGDKARSKSASPVRSRPILWPNQRTYDFYGMQSVS